MTQELDSRETYDQSSKPSTANDKDKSARLGTDPIGKLLLHYSLPAILGMTVSSLYSVIDRIFIGNGVGPYAISGLALTMPMMNLMMAFGAMIGAGASTMISIRMGQKRTEDATNILGNTLILNFIIGFIIMVLGLIYLDDILTAFGASDKTLPYARDFMQIVLISSLFSSNFYGLNNVMRATGYPKKAMYSSMLSVGVNLILAPIFIFVLHWGIRGAALATAIAQLCGFIWVFSHFMNKSHFIHFQQGYFKLKKRIIRDILSIGMSPFLMNVGASVVAMIINMSLHKYGGGGERSDMAIGAYGIVNAVAILFVMVTLGLTMGMQPIVGYNYGARQNHRALRAYKLTAVAAVLVTTTGFLLAMFIPRPLASLFTKDLDLINQSVIALRTVLLIFPLVGFQIVTTSFFQSVGKAYLAIILSLSRQLLFLIPFVLIFPHFWGLHGVWMASPAGDLLSSLITIALIATQWKKILPASSPIPDK
ncbi:MAG TPA: MATE family efflux transporter [Bacteroidales bacterium]|nr:MATE family efflux transporter [Bacteroidales bacterium]